MGRFPSIAAAKAKTGAAKAKVYSMYAKEIYSVAKRGGSDPVANPSLKRVIDKAKKEQVPADVIKRAIDKVNSGANENYDTLRYEGFGPGASNLIVECLTDNVNRAVADVRGAFSKAKCKLASEGAVSYMYDTVCVFRFTGLTEDEVLECLLNDEVNADIEVEGDYITLYGDPSLYFKIKSAITSYNEVNFEVDEITTLSKDKVVLTGEDKEQFIKLLTLLDNVDDVQNVYHNVDLEA